MEVPIANGARVVAGAKLRALVVVEQPAAVATYRDTLLALGHTPIIATTTAEAASVFRQDLPELALIDLSSREIDGHGICRYIRASVQGNDAYVLVVASPAESSLDGLISESGADDFLIAPVTSLQLGVRMQLVVRNILQRHARRDAELALARAQWLAGIGETSLALQHEINNPLTAIIGSATLLETGEYSHQERHEFLQTIVDQAHRIGDVVHRLASLRNPRSASYIRGTKMLDLSGRENRGGK